MTVRINNRHTKKLGKEAVEKGHNMGNRTVKGPPYTEKFPVYTGNARSWTDSQKRAEEDPKLSFLADLSGFALHKL